jgi:hypothetical protein
LVDIPERSLEIALQDERLRDRFRLTAGLPAKASERGAHRIGLAQGGFDSSLGLEQRLSREAVRHRFL